MFKAKQIKISIPNDLIFGRLVAENAKSLSGILGFSARAAQEIEMATEEIASDIIQKAFEREQEDYIDITFNLNAAGLEIVINEQGLPYDPALEKKYSPEILKNSWSDKGLGMYLVKKVLDGFSFHNLGRQGKETRLFKYLDQARVESLLSREEIKNLQQKEKAGKLPKAGVRYSVRRLRPEEAVEVSRCVYAAYGYTYLHEDMYYPDRVRALNENGDMISFVAVTDSKEIIAHAAMILEEDKLVPEFGVAATKPRFRGQGCLNALGQARANEAKKLGFVGGYGMGVTTHFYSQKAMLKHGMKPCALLLSNAEEPRYCDIKPKNIQRESAVMHFIYFKHPDNIIIYPPQEHADFIAAIYSNLGVRSRSGEVGALNRPCIRESNVRVKTDSDRLTADIRINSYGDYIVQEIAAKLKLLGSCPVKTVYLYLPLTDINTATHCRKFESLGFFFAGIKPGSDGDFLVLQCLNGYDIDYKQIVVGCEFSQWIKDYVQKCGADSSMI